jgi:predicted phage terminase large subunit-like protein
VGQISPHPGPQTAFLSCTADIAIFGGSAGPGKRAPLTSDIITPYGVKKLININVGDSINNPDGSIGIVECVHPIVNDEEYRITFHDYTSALCGPEHLWLAWRSGKGIKVNGKRIFGESSGKVIDTLRLKKWCDRAVEQESVGERPNWPLIPVCKEQCFAAIDDFDFGINPYAMGALLGNGCLRKNTITFDIHRDDVPHYEEILGVYNLTGSVKGGLGYKFNFIGDSRKDLLAIMRLYGLDNRRSHEKFIPDAFKWASINDRYSIIQGLLDTDGHVEKDGYIEYSSSSKQLADDVAFILRSLGSTVVITPKEPFYRDANGEKVYCHTSYRLYIKHPQPEKLFRIERKKSVLQGLNQQLKMYRRVVSVERTGNTVPMRCITVSNPNGLYMCNDFIVTHNSFCLLLDPLRNVADPAFNGVTFRRTSKQVTIGGGLWDTSVNLYRSQGAVPIEGKLTHRFPSGAKIAFSHLEHEKNRFDHQGAQYPFIGFDELTHFCLTEDTDVLTDSGWKNIKDLSNGDKAASLNHSWDIEYKKIKQLHAFNYDGDLKCIKQRNGVSFRVTPNHNVMVSSNKRTEWKFRKAQEVTKGCYIPRSGNFIGNEVDDVLLDMPNWRGHGKNSNSINKLNIDVWIKFLGWYFSEGCAFPMKNRTNSRIVNIRQTKIEHVKEISDILDELGYRWKYRKDGSFIICSRQLYDLLKPYGNQHERRLPKWLLGSSKRQQRLFWDCFVGGDGYINKSKGITIGLCSSGLIDDLQIMAFNLGLVATKSYHRTKSGFDVWRISVSERSHCQTKPNDWYTEKYSGKVYCPEVEDNNNFYIRVNGRCCWTGNSRAQFWYLVTRSRRPDEYVGPCYVRATTNPTDKDDPIGGWVRELVDWWIDPDTGYAIQERSGVIRYMTVQDDKVIWVPEDWRDEDGQPPKSFTFIAATLDDNPSADPSYKSTLSAQDAVTKERLLHGNWNISYKGGMFKPEWFKIVDQAPDGIKWLRYWDFAASEVKPGKNPDWTAGPKVGLYGADLYIADVEHFRTTPAVTETKVRLCADRDGRVVEVGIEEEKGSAGKFVTMHFKKNVLPDRVVYADTPTGEKTERARPWCALAENGHVFLLRGPWNQSFLSEAGAFPLGKRDQIDGVSGAYKLLTSGNRVFKDYRGDTSNFVIGWDNLDNGTRLIVSQWTDSAQNTGVLFMVWTAKTGRLIVFDEFLFGSPAPERVISSLISSIRKTTGNLYRNLQGWEWYANDEMFSKTGSGDMRSAYRKYRITLRKNVRYDENGAILYGQRILERGKLLIHDCCQNFSRQMSSWTMNDTKPESGHLLARAFCNVVSILWEQGKIEPALKKLKPYSYQGTAYFQDVERRAKEGKLYNDGVPLPPERPPSIVGDRTQKDGWMV